MNSIKLLGAYGLIGRNGLHSSGLFDDALIENLSRLPLGALPILQGSTDSSSTCIVVLNEAVKKYSYQITHTENASKPQWQLQERSHYPGSPYAFEKLIITGLAPGHDYHLKVIEDSTGAIIDDRAFRSLNITDSKARFILGSCVNDSYVSGFCPMWEAVYNAHPDFVLLVGDTVYADHGNNGTELGLWTRYCQTRSRIPYFRYQRLIPTITTWDDHDFGINNGNKKFRHRAFMQNLFNLAWANEGTATSSPGPGVSTCFNAFGQRFFLMDDRSFRDDAKTGGLQWGQKQQEFLLEHLHQDSSPAWLLNGTQYFGGYLKTENFESDFAANWQMLLQEFRKVDAPLILGSGDVHFSEVMHLEPELLGYPSYEVTGSSMHSTTFPGQHLRAKNPRRSPGKANSSFNFLLIESQVKKGALGLDLKIECHNSRGLAFDFQGDLKRG